MVLTFFFALFSSIWAASPVVEETLYQNFRQNILTGNKSKSGFTTFEQRLYVDALWDLTEEGSPHAQLILEKGQFFHFELAEQLRLGILKGKLSQNLVTDLENHLRFPDPDSRIIYLIAAYSSELSEIGQDSLVSLAQGHALFADVEAPRPMDGRLVKDIFDFASPAEGVRLYMFCRQNRVYPCLMVLRDSDGSVVRNEDGTLWTHKALAASAKGIPSTQRNGHTPAGILLLDSVMPVADQQISFGKFRRLILDFLPKSKEEEKIKSLLPTSSHEEKWWRPNVVARDIGRDLLRIHGTGKINEDPESPFYPFMRTSGCIAQRENTYDGVTYQDQRDLLDALMIALKLKPTYENEPSIKGVLYLMEIDNEAGAVSEEDLALRGIL